MLLHVASSHYNIPYVLGVGAREAMKPAEYEKSSTEKSVVVAALNEAFALTRGAVLYFMARHTGEHTGQLIAYTRIIGVVPPWSER